MNCSCYIILKRLQYNLFPFIKKVEIFGEKNTARAVLELPARVFFLW